MRIAEGQRKRKRKVIGKRVGGKEGRGQRKVVGGKQREGSNEVGRRKWKRRVRQSR